MHIKSICLRYRYMQLQRLDGLLLGRFRATAEGDDFQVEEQVKI